MKRISKNISNEIELLEKHLTKKLSTYKDFKNSNNNETYFDNLHYKSIKKGEEKWSVKNILITPSLGYVVLFIISFYISFQMIDFNSAIFFSDELYLFSETSLWLEEEIFISSIFDEELNLDYSSYFNNELDYYSMSYQDIEIIQFSDIDFDEFYKNIKNKKIL